MSRKIAIGKGFAVKNGRVVKTDHHLNVSLRLKRRASKRVRVARSARNWELAPMRKFLGFALAGMFLAGTALGQESPPTCHGLNYGQCKQAPGCEWVEALMRLPGWEHRACIPMCVREGVYGITKNPNGPGWFLKRPPRWLIP
jgi:hypothetical protein